MSHQDNLFQMRYKSNVLKDTTCKLKISECSRVIAFENLYRIVSLCDFQNIWTFSVFVTMSIHSWLLFTLIACWIAISEEMSLKSIISFLLNQIPWISFSWFKASNQVQRCMNWKDIVISSISFSRWYDPMWIMSILFLLSQLLKFSIGSLILCHVIWFYKSDCLILNTGYVRPVHRIPVSFFELIR
jgi:hypothetical protein